MSHLPNHMKSILFYLLGAVLLFPLKATEALGLSLDTFRDSVLRPSNLPSGTSAKDVPVEFKVNAILNFAINLILYAAGAGAVLFLIIGAIQYITAMGNQERIDPAKKTIKFALIGLAVVIFAYAIVTNIINLIYRTTI